MKTNLENYSNVFKDYPDVVDIKIMCKMLGGINRKSAYKLLNENKIEHFKIGRTFYIPKYHILRYLGIIDNESNL